MNLDPRGFVVMPFSVKSTGSEDEEGPPKEIDFDEIYRELLAPAMRIAGMEPFRADQEKGAGPIRTDMYYELVTAELVVADVSILNPNVFYELGVRHAASPSGVFLVHGGWAERPFDIAPDRTFSYEGRLFETPKPGRDTAWKKRLESQVDQLGLRLRQALGAEKQTVGSPVYAALPGLEPVDFENVSTARSRYFRDELEDWRARVRVARDEGRVADMLTLARAAPNRRHAAELLLDCARALLSLERYWRAEDLLRELLKRHPSHFEARCQLGRALGRQGETAAAEELLRTAVQERPGDPQAQELIGDLYRDAWVRKWQDEDNLERRRELALRHSVIAVNAISSYDAAFRRRPGAYGLGCKVATLVRMLSFLGEKTGKAPSPHMVSDVDDVVPTVRLAARSALGRSLLEGPSAGPDVVREGVKGALALGELEFVFGASPGASQASFDEPGSARDWIRGAASSPLATREQLDGARRSISLCERLGYNTDVATALLEEIESSPPITAPRELDAEYALVLVHGEAQPRSDGVWVRTLEEQLDQWGVDERWLAICLGIDDENLAFAKACHERGARIRVLLARRSGEAETEMIALGGIPWQQRYASIRDELDVVEQPERLGKPPSYLDAARWNLTWGIDTGLAASANRPHVVALVGEAEKASGWDAIRSVDCILRVISPRAETIP